MENMQLAEVLQDEYQRRFEGNEAYRARVWELLCSQIFAGLISRDASLLDLGAGWGEFTRAVKAGRKFAMDLNPDTGKRVAGVAEFLHQDCASPWPLAEGSLDCVFTSNFLEHLPGKALIERALEEAFRCLRPGGRVICMGPNIKYIPGLYWDYWDHHTPISDASLAEVLGLKGFVIERAIPRFLPYSMSGGKNPPLFMVALYLRMPWVWPLLGKQFLIVARKPGPA